MLSNKEELEMLMLSTEKTFSSIRALMEKLEEAEATIEKSLIADYCNCSNTGENCYHAETAEVLKERVSS